MKVKVDQDKCIGCGSCVSLTNEEIFEFDEEGKANAKVNEVDEQHQEETKTAIEYCPTGAISEEK